MADKTAAGKDDATDWSGVISTVGAVTLVTALVMTLGFATVFGLAGSKLANRSGEAPASTTSLGTAPAGYAAAVPAAPELPADPGVALPVDPAVPAPAPAAELPPALAELPPAVEAAPLAAPEPAAPAGPAPETTAPTTAAPERSSSTGFMVTDANPTAARLGEIIHFLVATPAPDAEKARNLEGGQRAVVVPKTVYNLGLFRAPRGSNAVTGIVSHSGDVIVARLQAQSAGRPTVNTNIEFKRIGGNWRLSNNSICRGVKTVGLQIHCNA